MTLRSGEDASLVRRDAAHTAAVDLAGSLPCGLPPLRIVHVTASPFAAQSADGVQLVVKCLARAQAELGQAVAVFSRVDGIHFVGGARDSGPMTPPVVLRRSGGIRLRLVSRGVGRGVAQRLLDWTPDIVHFHSVHIIRNVAMAAHLSRAGVAYCATTHGGLFPAALRRGRLKKVAFNLLFERQYLNAARFIHAVSPHEVEAIRKYGVRCPIVIVPNGVVCEAVAQPLRPDALYDRAPWLRQRRVFMFIGRLDTRQKGLDLLVRAFALAGLRDTALVLVGPDCRGERGALQALAGQLGILSQVVFTGPAFGQDHANLLAAADVFVHTSRWEGLSLSVLAAAAGSKPCLITRDADPLGQLERAGAAIVVEPTVESIASGMTRCMTLDRNELQTMGERARRVADAQFTWSSIAASLMEAYRHALGSSTPSF